MQEKYRLRLGVILIFVSVFFFGTFVSVFGDYIKNQMKPNGAKVVADSLFGIIFPLAIGIAIFYGGYRLISKDDKDTSTHIATTFFLSAIREDQKPTIIPKRKIRHAISLKELLKIMSIPVIIIIVIIVLPYNDYISNLGKVTCAQSSTFFKSVFTFELFVIGTGQPPTATGADVPKPPLEIPDTINNHLVQLDWEPTQIQAGSNVTFGVTFSDKQGFPLQNVNYNFNVTDASGKSILNLKNQRSTIGGPEIHQ
jgi:hypothetical protein